jgi:hypothetical protein
MLPACTAPSRHAPINGEFPLNRFAVLVDRFAALAPATVPGDRLQRLQQAFRRRLDDAVVDVFQRACLSRDLDTAAELLTVLENMNERRRRTYGGERRISDATVAQAREELARRRVMQPLEPPADLD